MNEVTTTLPIALSASPASRTERRRDSESSSPVSPLPEVCRVSAETTSLAYTPYSPPVADSLFKILRDFGNFLKSGIFGSRCHPSGWLRPILRCCRDPPDAGDDAKPRDRTVPPIMSAGWHGFCRLAFPDEGRWVLAPANSILSRDGDGVDGSVAQVAVGWTRVAGSIRIRLVNRVS